MKLLFDFFPILVFFVGFKLYGIYVATIASIIASLIQVIGYWMKSDRFESMHLITLGAVVVFGGATLLFRDPAFIKWKPTAVYWASASAFLLSHFLDKRNILQRAMDKSIFLPKQMWSRLNAAWAAFFGLMGCMNLYIAYRFDLDTWVNFKFFGGLGLTLIFVFLQALYLSKHGSEHKIPSS